MLPKAKYMKLSSAAKSRVKAKLGMSRKSVARKTTRRTPRVYGHGDYFTAEGEKRTKDPLKGYGARLGRAAFGPLGGYLGAFGHRIAKVFGVGDYKVSSNVLVTGKQVPSFSSSGREATIVHREYLGDVLSTTGFNVQAFPINPGMALTFPWASTLANNYEQYCISGMIFQYKTTSATSLTTGASTAMGSVLMATQYDSVSPLFTSESQMLNHEFSTSCVPSRDCQHPIECARGETPVSCLYTRNAAPPANADKRLYDLGTFQIATIGQQHAGDVIGQLWVTYVFTLLKPQIATAVPVTLAPVMDHYYLGTAVGDSTLMQTSLPFGTVPTLSSQSNMGTSISRASVLVLPNLGVPYVAFMALTASAVTTGTLSASVSVVTTTGGITQNNLFSAGGAPNSIDQVQTSNGVTNTIYCMCSLNIPVGGGTVTYGGPTWSGSAPANFIGDLFISVAPVSIDLIEEKKSRPPVVRSVKDKQSVVWDDNDHPKEAKSSLPLPEEDDDDDRYEDPDYLEYLLQKAKAAKALKDKAATLRASFPEMPKPIQVSEPIDSEPYEVKKPPPTPPPQRVLSRK